MRSDRGRFSQTCLIVRPAMHYGSEHGSVVKLPSRSVICDFTARGAPELRGGSRLMYAPEGRQSLFPRRPSCLGPCHGTLGNRRPYVRAKCAYMNCYSACSWLGFSASHFSIPFDLACEKSDTYHTHVRASQLTLCPCCNDTLGWLFL